jgi:hypothetical protein
MKSNLRGVEWGRRGGHPQQPALDATASAFAAVPQQPPDASASAAVPQHGAAAVSAGSASATAAAGPPQQLPVPLTTLSAAAGSPANLTSPIVLLLCSLLEGRERPAVRPPSRPSVSTFL